MRNRNNCGLGGRYIGNGGSGSSCKGKIIIATKEGMSRSAISLEC